MTNGLQTPNHDYRPSDQDFASESSLISTSVMLEAGSKKPRIAMISTHGYVAARPPLGASDTGGQVVYVLEISKKLAQLGYQVDIWTRRFEHQPEVEFVEPGVRIIRVPCGGPDFIPKEYLCDEIPEWCENALAFIREYGLNYSLINSHYWDAGIAGDLLGRQLEVPHIHTPHSLGLWKMRQMRTDYPDDHSRFEQQYNFQERIRRERYLCRHSHLIIATSPSQLEMLSNDYGVSSQRCRLVPPGYDDHRFFSVGEASRQAIRSRLGFSGRVILSLGRLARNKGYDLLIDGFSVLASREPDVMLHLAVGGEALSPSEQKILQTLQQQAAELGLTERIQFGAFIPDDQLADYYRAADMFVLSSRYEPFGMTAIEAMACGTPTVVTIHGGLHRSLTFGRSAIFADPFDREDLGISMLKILRYTRLRNRLSHLGAHRVRSLFTWTGVAQQLLSSVNDDPELVQDSEVEWSSTWTEVESL
ncbi:MAG: glycosyltransferase [Planctomycetaceae bacterium]|nr:glycosyltransferase [Planctomycetaceae bacterium]